MKILNRIVTFILAVAVFPAAVTRIMIRIIIAPGGLLNSVMGDTAIKEELSVIDIINYIQEGTLDFLKDLFNFDNLPIEVNAVKGWLFASAAMLVLALLIALIIMGCALFTQAHKTVMGFSFGGALSCFLAMSFFTKFTAPFTAGKVDIGAILGKNLEGTEGIVGSILSSAISGVVDFKVFQLGNAVITMALLFIGILFWTFAYYITLSPEAKAAIKNPPVKEKKVKAKKEKEAKVSK